MTRPPGTVVRVDTTICIGAGLCEQHAPTTFEIGEDGAAVVLEPVRDDLATLQNAARRCPSGAISIEAPEEGQA